MKATQRVVYLELSNGVNATLCTFCKHAAWSGYCADGKECECEHPLEDKLPAADWEVEPGQDCWGYRPCLPVVDIADIAGLVLSNGFDEWSWGRDNGKLIVYGRKLAPSDKEE